MSNKALGIAIIVLLIAFGGWVWFDRSGAPTPATSLVSEPEAETIPTPAPIAADSGIPPVAPAPLPESAPAPAPAPVSPTPPANQAPVVNAGADQKIVLPATATLAGSATDDGLPNDTLTYSWSKVSGPGTVSFSNAAASASTATFSLVGDYILRLTVSDGSLSAYDELKVSTDTVVPTFGHWKFDETSGTTATDSSGKGNHGTLLNGISRVAGGLGGSLSFDGLDDYVTINRPIKDDFTVVAWFKISGSCPTGEQAYEGNGIIWADIAGVGNDMIPMACLNNKLAFGAGGTEDSTLLSKTSVNTGQWIHAAVTRVKSTGLKTIYINGVADSTQTGSTVSLDSNSKMYFGGNTLDSRYFKGLLDDVRIYNRALLAQEVSNLYTYTTH